MNSQISIRIVSHRKEWRFGEWAFCEIESREMDTVTQLRHRPYLRTQYHIRYVRYVKHVLNYGTAHIWLLPYTWNQRYIVISGNIQHL